MPARTPIKSIQSCLGVLREMCEGVYPSRPLNSARWSYEYYSLQCIGGSAECLKYTPVREVDRPTLRRSLQGRAPAMRSPSDRLQDMHYIVHFNVCSVLEAVVRDGVVRALPAAVDEESTSPSLHRQRTRTVSGALLQHTATYMLRCFPRPGKIHGSEKKKKHYKLVFPEQRDSPDLNRPATTRRQSMPCLLCAFKQVWLEIDEEPARRTSQSAEAPFSAACPPSFSPHQHSLFATPFWPAHKAVVTACGAGGAEGQCHVDLQLGSHQDSGRLQAQLISDAVKRFSSPCFKI